jgi:hypothetical protein
MNPRHQQAARPTDVPVPGFYRARLVKRGPYVACRIMQMDDGWLLLVGGEPTEAAVHVNPWVVRRMESVAMYGDPITAETYDAMLAEAAAAPPGHPLRNPTQPVDLKAAGAIITRRTT